eukprot:UC4_evm11s1211
MGCGASTASKLPSIPDPPVLVELGKDFIRISAPLPISSSYQDRDHIMNPQPAGRPLQEAKVQLGPLLFSEIKPDSIAPGPTLVPECMSNIVDSKERILVTVKDPALAFGEATNSLIRSKAPHQRTVKRMYLAENSDAEVHELPEFLFGGLEGGTPYAVRFVAQNEFGWTEGPCMGPLLTLPDPTGPTLLRHDDTTITLKLPLQATLNTVTFLAIHRCKDLNFGENDAVVIPINDTLPSSSEFNDTDVEPCEFYYYRFEIHNASGSTIGPASTNPYTTKPPFPSNPPAPTATKATSEDVSLEWPAQKQAITKMILEAAVQNGDGVTKEQYIEQPHISTGHVFSGLPQDTVFKFRLIVQNATGTAEGEWSIPIRTKPAVKYMPTKPTIEKVLSGTKVLLNFPRIDDDSIVSLIVQCTAAQSFPDPDEEHTCLDTKDPSLVMSSVKNPLMATSHIVTGLQWQVFFDKYGDPIAGVDVNYRARLLASDGHQVIAGDPSEYFRPGKPTEEELNVNLVQIGLKKNKIPSPLLPIIGSPEKDWTLLRVYVSSTSTEMAAERSHLANHTFPLLNDTLESRRIRLLMVDMRLGEEVEKQDKRYPSICLEEIKNCHFFIGLAGQEYGWTPGKRRVDYCLPDTNEYSFLDDFEGRSLNHLECYFAATGVESSDSQGRCSFLYTRGQDYTKSKRFQTALKKDSTILRRQGMAETILQNELLSSFNNAGSKTYQVKWSTSAASVAGLSQFSEMILEDIAQYIFVLFPQVPSNEIYSLDTYNYIQKCHVDSLVSKAFNFDIGTLAPELEKWVREDTVTEDNGDTVAVEQNVRLIVGSRGSGLSSLCASIVDDFQSEMIVFYHFVRASSDSSSIDSILSRLCEGIMCRLHDESEKLTDDYDELIKVFPQLLHKLSKASESKILLIIDGLGQMESIFQPHLLDWIPHFLPQNTKFILTCHNGDNLLNYSSFLGLKIIELPNLAHEQCQEMVKIDMKKRDHVLNSADLGCLLGKTDGHHPFYLSLCTDIICTEFSYYRSKALTDLIKEIPGTLSGVVDRLIKDVINKAGKEYVIPVITCLAASRTGLTVTELMGISGFIEDLKTVESRCFTRGKISYILHYLKPLFRPFYNCGHRGENLIDFASSAITCLVVETYMMDLGINSVKPHRILSEMFAKSHHEDGAKYHFGVVPRSLTELPYHQRCSQFDGGSVVAVRVRPFDEREKLDGKHRIVSMVGNRTKFRNIQEMKEYYYTFNYSFWSHDRIRGVYASQSTLFKTIGVDVISKFFGSMENVCVMAYGQTGSGKTYCMFGREGELGLIPRISLELFRRIESNINPNCIYELRASILEVYGNQVRDLSNPGSPPLKVRDNSDGSAYADGAVQPLIDSEDDLRVFLRSGMSNRHIASTEMNEESSRAHTLVQLFLKKRYTENGSEFLECECRMDLVDLAGSERASTMGTKYTKERVKEGAAINMALTTLNQCISSAAENQRIRRDDSRRKSQRSYARIPVRESKLTHLLKDTITGNNRIVMIATVSPSSANSQETMSTLRYADITKSLREPNNISYKDVPDVDRLADPEESKKEKHSMKIVDRIWRGQNAAILCSGTSMSQKTLSLYSRSSSIGLFTRCIKEIFARINELDESLGTVQIKYGAVEASLPLSAQGAWRAVPLKQSDFISSGGTKDTNPIHSEVRLDNGLATLLLGMPLKTVRNAEDIFNITDRLVENLQEVPQIEFGDIPENPDSGGRDSLDHFNLWETSYKLHMITVTRTMKKTRAVIESQLFLADCTIPRQGGPVTNLIKHLESLSERNEHVPYSAELCKRVLLTSFEGCKFLSDWISSREMGDNVSHLIPPSGREHEVIEILEDMLEFVGSLLVCVGITQQMNESSYKKIYKPEKKHAIIPEMTTKMGAQVETELAVRNKDKKSEIDRLNDEISDLQKLEEKFQGEINKTRDRGMLKKINEVRFKIMEAKAKVEKAKL